MRNPTNKWCCVNRTFKRLMKMKYVNNIVVKRSSVKFRIVHMVKIICWCCHSVRYIILIKWERVSLSLSSESRWIVNASTRLDKTWLGIRMNGFCQLIRFTSWGYSQRIVHTSEGVFRTSQLYKALLCGMISPVKLFVAISIHWFGWDDFERTPRSFTELHVTKMTFFCYTCTSVR